MSAPLYFVPWLRRGLGLELGVRDTGQATLPRGAPVDAYVELDGEPAYGTLALRPPDHATGIDPGQIIRRYPQPNAVDAEYGYFPLIELAAPDLPWVLTPAVADEAASAARSTGRLRPWLVLVCVEDASAELVAATGDRPAQLLVPADQLPDLGESYAWVHVQSTVPAGDVIGSLDAPGTVVARLVCPRRLEPGIRYRAALVLAFAAAGDQLVPAWDAATPAPALTVYDTWTFTTGDAGSFEELCRRLGPVADESLELGLHAMDVTELGSVDPWPSGTQRVVVDYSGALCDAEITPRQLGNLKDEFDNAVTDLLEEGTGRVELAPGDPDPVVTPPFVGSFAADTDEIPDTGWLRTLNLTPNRRAAAGLGAEIVRIHQERFMAAAWRQAGAIREANRELSVTRMQAEIGRTWRHRANRLDDLQRVAVLRGQLTFVRDDDNQPPRRRLQQSTIPDALTSPAYLRVTRPGAVAATAVAARGRGERTWTSAVATSFGSADARRDLGFAVVGVPHGTALDAKRLLVTPPPDDLDLASVARLTATAIRPVATARTRVLARIPVLADLLSDSDDDLPTHVRWGPVIDEALVWSLVDLSPELLLPGVGGFPQNSVRVVEGDPAFVAALLGGANHEMSRELLWREFPADLASTTFKRFWDRPNLDDCDIVPMADWPETARLDTLGAAGGESVVLLVRGDLVMHYPSVRFLLVDPTTKVASLPSFSGWIPPDVRFVAFDVADADAVTAAGSRWKVVIEEQPSEPRFGLDSGDGTRTLEDWSDLEWEHLTGQDGATHLIVGDGGFPSKQAPPPDATWGLNSAHMARVTYQAPFRITFRVIDLVGSAT